MTTTENLAADYAERISRGFYDADPDAPFGYRDDSDTEYEALSDVLDHYAEENDLTLDERAELDDEYDAENLPDGYRVVSAHDYLADALDFRYTIASDRTYHSGEICIALGGPTAWLNLEDATVEVYWGGKAVESIPYAVRDALGSALEELWEMGA